MKEQIGAESRLNVSRDERQVSGLIKWAERFRWRNMEGEGKHLERAPWVRESSDDLSNLRNNRRTLLEDNPASG